MRRHQSRAADEALYHEFQEHCSELYWLALLLTGDREWSIQAFTKALDLEHEGNAADLVSEVRRLVILASLDAIRAELRESALRTERSPAQDSSDLAALASHPNHRRRWTRSNFEQAVLAIDAFPRCALLLTVFEKLPIEDAALLLNADEALVRVAQGLGLTDLARNTLLGERNLRFASAMPDSPASAVWHHAQFAS